MPYLAVSFNHAAASLLTTAGNEVPLLFSNNGCPNSRRAEREQSLGVLQCKKLAAAVGAPSATAGTAAAPATTVARVCALA